MFPTQTENVKKFTKVGTYDILDTIGHGNYSVCKLARHSVSKIKVLFRIHYKIDHTLM